jgi:hypothetical protein
MFAVALVVGVFLSSLFTLLWMRNLQRGYERLEEWADHLDVEVDELILSVEAVQDNVADITLHFATPLDQVIFDADITEEQEWDVRFVFAKARARLWSSDDREMMPHVVQDHELFPQDLVA